MERRKVIMDFDNTMGVPGCDVDDGLALLYLLGRPELCEVLACTCSYGNSDIDTVYANTLDFFDEFGIDIDIYRGCEKPFDPAKPAATDSSAAGFLADTVAGLPGQVDILVTGTTTNLMGAYLRDPRFFDNVGSLTFMGGITSQLVFDGVVMDELNLSSDVASTAAALIAPCPVTVATSQHCLSAFFTPDEFSKMLFDDALPGGRKLYRRCRYWFDDMLERYGLDGFVCWDVVAAALLLEPELFDDETMSVLIDKDLLERGLLWRGKSGESMAMIHTPSIADPETFCAQVYSTWRRALKR